MKLLLTLLATSILFNACKPSAPNDETKSVSEELQVDSTEKAKKSPPNVRYVPLACGALFKDSASGKDTLVIRALFRFKPTGIVYYNFMFCHDKGQPALSIDYTYNKSVMEKFCANSGPGEVVPRKYEATFPSQDELAFSENSLDTAEKSLVMRLLLEKEANFIPVVLSEIGEIPDELQKPRSGDETIKAGIGRKLKKAKGYVTRNF